MNYKKSKAVIKARMSLIQQTFNEIDPIPENCNFLREMFYIIANYGL